MDSVEQSVVFRNIILNTKKPLVFKQFSTNWNCFDCSIEEWCEKFDASSAEDKKLEFEQMPTKFCDIPQWERYRSKLNTTFTDFIEKHSKDTDKWTTFGYQPSKSIPIDCRKDIDFGCFGFSEATKDASFWLSSKGANTPCHFDTYGCNIVVQVYGRKHWLLFPPETALTPTRIPYEESSVYCSENFYSPKDLESLSIARQNVFECVLEKGDSLVVPRNWWHYVESLETSLSVNTWIPLKIDNDAQIEECIVKYIVENNLTRESEETKRCILNPNQLKLIATNDELFDILHFLVEHKTNENQNDEVLSYEYEYLSEAEVQKLIETCEDEISVLNPLHPNDFDCLLRERTKRYIDMEQPDQSNIQPVHEALLNAICHPNVIKLIKDEFLKKYPRR